MKKKLIVTFLCALAATALISACGETAKPSVSVLFDYECDIVDYTQVVVKGGTVQMPDKPKRDGYIFAGWFEKDGDGNYKEIPFDFIETKADAAITLYAKWEVAPKDMQKPPETAELSFSNGVLSVQTEENTEISFNDGAYSTETQFEIGYSARAKVCIRKTETAIANYSEPLVLYYSSAPDLSLISFEASQTDYQCVLTTVTGEDMYEYKFENSESWMTGNEFKDLTEKEEQSVSVRLRADGKYPVSDIAVTTVSVRLDTEMDTLDDVIYIWGGNVNTSTIALNTDAAGLNGAESRQSIVINDFDLTGYNDWAIKIPTGFTAFSADVKVLVSTTATITKDLPVTNGTGNYLGVIKLGKWQEIFGYNGDWIVTFAFPELVKGNAPKGTATIYLDNIVYYTQAEVDGYVWNEKRFVDNSTGTGDGDALADMQSKFDITLGTNGSLYKNYRNRYVLQTVANQINGNHVIKIKAPNITDISEFGGVSFAIDLQLAGSGVGKYPVYLLNYGKTVTATETLVGNENVTKIHEYTVDRVGGEFNGCEIVTITSAQLVAAGYDLTNLTDLTIVIRDVELTGGWWNIYNMFFFDFKVF